MLNIKAALAAVLLVLSGVSSYAAATTKSSVKLELGADDNNGRNYYVSGRHAFANDMIFRAGAGESTSEDTSNAEVISDYWAAGVQSDPATLVSLGVDKIYSSQEGGLEIDSLALTLDLNTLNWNVFISPERRDISFTTVRNPRKITFESDGMAAGISYYGWEPVYFSFNKVTYDYPALIATLNNRITLVTFIFGVSVVDHVFNLEDERWTLEAGYYFNRGSVAISTSEGQSVVDQSISTINRVYANYDLSQNWTAGISVGTSRTDINSETTRFAGGSLSYSWQ